MAYMNQEMKSKLAPKIKAVLNKYGIKGTIAVRHNSTLVLNIKSGKIDFLKVCEEKTKLPSHGNINVNTYHIDSYFDGIAAQFLHDVKDAMMIGNWDNSMIEVDYFDKGWYIDINIGKWDNPYVCE